MFFMFFGGFVILCLILLILSAITRITFGKNRVLRFISTIVIVLSVTIPTILMLLMAFGNQFHFSGTYYTIHKQGPVAEMELNWTGDFNIKIYDCENQKINGIWEYDYNDLENYIRLNLENGATIKCNLENETVSVNLEKTIANCEHRKFRMKRNN